MLGFRPLQVAKRKLHYNEIPAYDVEDLDYEKHSSSDDESYNSSATSSPYSSRSSSSAYVPPKRALRAPFRPSVSAYSYKNPRAFTRYFGLAIGTTILLFIFFLFHRSWASIQSAELGLHKVTPEKPVWESFPFLKRYHGGIRTLVSRKENVPEYPTKEDIDPEMPEQEAKEVSPKEKRSEGGNVPDSVPFNPYPDYESKNYIEEYGPVKTCYLDAKDKIQIPPMRAYNGITKGTPDNVIGSYDLLGLRNDVCFERFGRLGPYGLGYSKRRGGTGAAMEGEREGSEKVWEQSPEVDFREVKWADALDRCLEKNKHRFKPMSDAHKHKFQTMTASESDATTLNVRVEGDKKSLNGTVRASLDVKHNKLLPRTAVLIRT